MAATNEAMSNKAIIERIIANNLKPHCPPDISSFIKQDWQALLVQLAEQQGKDSRSWRDAVRMLTHLALYTDPSIKQQYPEVESRLLPSLLQNMKSKLADVELANPSLDPILASRPDDEPGLATSKTEPEQTDDHSSDNDMLAFDIKAEDLPNKQQAEPIAKVDRGNTVEFESFAVSDEQSQSTDAEQQQAISAASGLELEPLEIDISDQQVNEAELEQELTELTQQLDDKVVSAEELPPLELDLSDFDDDKSK